MTARLTDICLLTFVLQKHHCQILDDWIDFFDHPISKLILHTAADPDVRVAVDALAIRRGIELVHVGTTTAAETTDYELNLLIDQFSHVSEAELACLIKLDTFPFRAPGTAWQDNALLAMQREKALFLTGSTLPYRNDLPTKWENLLLTQRVSNCFLMVSKETWLQALQPMFDTPSEFGRFSSEGDFESYLARTNQFGLRLVNTMAVRVLHCHEWGPRQREIRDAFRRGKGVKKYLAGYQDDYFGPNAKYYMKKPPSLIKRLRIAVGKLRRRL